MEFESFNTADFICTGVCLAHFRKFSQNMANIYLGLLYQTVVLVVDRFREVHIYWLYCVYISSYLIMSMYLVVVRTDLVGSAFSTCRLARLREFKRGEIYGFLHGFLSWSHDECKDSEHIPVNSDGGVAASSRLAQAMLLS